MMNKEQYTVCLKKHHYTAHSVKNISLHFEEINAIQQFPTIRIFLIVNYQTLQ